jgi:hypothetical protein
VLSSLHQSKTQHQRLAIFPEKQRRTAFEHNHARKDWIEHLDLVDSAEGFDVLALVVIFVAIDLYHFDGKSFTHNLSVYILRHVVISEHKISLRRIPVVKLCGDHADYTQERQVHIGRLHKRLFLLIPQVQS